MKFFIQIFLIIITIFTTGYFYKKFFKQNTNKIIADNIPKSESNLENIDINKKNNVITNLEYSVKFNENNYYSIISKQSKISNNDNIDNVEMEKVKGIYKIEKLKNMIIITSERAIYNNLDYFTTFYKNVQINYLEHFITSDKLIFDPKNNTIKISENVIYNGIYGNIKTDNIEIDLVTNKINLYMTRPNDKVEITNSQKNGIY
jgi:hypothetical protein